MPRTPDVGKIVRLIGDSARDTDWALDAVCAQTDPDAFFPDKGGSTAEGKKICARCPVQDECLADALATGQRHGVWGGLSDRERRTFASTHGIATAPEPVLVELLPRLLSGSKPVAGREQRIAG